MTTFWLVVAISIGGGPFRALTDEKYPDLPSCQVAQEKAWRHLEDQHFGDEINEEWELGVSCQMHHSESKPL
jgi:hypothetical protein